MSNSDEYELVGLTERGEQVLRDSTGRMWVRESDGGLRVIRNYEAVSGVRSTTTRQPTEHLRSDRPAVTELSGFGAEVARSVRDRFLG